MNTLYEVLAFVGGSGALLAAVAWLIRTGLSHAMSRDLEGFKSQLQITANSQLEHLRHELKIIASDVEKRTALLNEKRANVVADLYHHLVDFVSAAESFAAVAEWSGEPPKEDKAKKLGAVAGEFVSYYQYHRIYFSEELSEKIKVLFDTIHGPTMEFRMWMNLKDRGGAAAQKHDEAWDRAWNTIQKEVPPILAAIEREFRTLLGVIK